MTPLPEPHVIVDNVRCWTEEQVRALLEQEQNRVRGVLRDLHENTTLHNYYKFAELRIYGE
jgi:hypothetical protein